MIPDDDDDDTTLVVQSGLYRIDYSPQLTANDIHPDSFGVTTFLFLDTGGQYRFFLADTLYAGPIPLLDQAGRWNSSATTLEQTSRLYGESLPEDYYSTPGIFYFEPLAPEDAPVRGITQVYFQRYEEDLVFGSNRWMTYRRVQPGLALSGTFNLQDTVLDQDNQPLPRREEWVLNAGGSFRVREYYDGALVVETLSDRWLQPGPYVFSVNPRRRFYDTLGVPGTWDTLYGDWVLSLRKVEADAFEKLDVYSWYDNLAWVRFQRAALARVGPADPAPATRAATAPTIPSARRPAGLDPAKSPWNRSGGGVLREGRFPRVPPKLKRP